MKRLSIALALVLALGDSSWASRMVAPRSAPAALPTVALGASPGAVHVAGLAAASYEQNRRWDAAPALQAAPEPVLVAPADAPLPPSLGPSALPAPEPARAIPMPPVVLERVGQAAAWAGLTGAAALAHAPFDRIGPLVVSIVMGLATGFMVAFFASVMQDEGGGRGPAPADRPITDAEKEDLRTRVDSLAAEAGLPAPKNLSTVPNDVLNAQAGPEEVRVYGGILDLPREQQEAVLRHEIAHVRHRDSVWAGIDMMVAAVPPMVALMAGMHSDGLSALALPLAGASLYLVGRGKKRAEYHADQYAASTQRTSRPLIEAFGAMARRDAADRAAMAPTTRWQAWAGKAEAAWDQVARLWRAHPPLASRVARLERLER